MLEQPKESWLSKLWKRIWGRTLWAIAVVIGAIIVASVFKQSWILGPAGVLAWFLTYPSLGGGPRQRRTVAYDGNRAAKEGSGSHKDAKGAALVTFGSSDERIVFVGQAKQTIETSILREVDGEPAQEVATFISHLQFMVATTILLIIKAEEARGKLDSGEEQYPEENSLALKLSRWDAKVDHAVSLVEVVLRQTVSRPQSGLHISSFDFVDWTATVLRETRWLATELIKPEVQPISSASEVTNDVQVEPSQS